MWVRQSSYTIHSAIAGGLLNSRGEVRPDGILALVIGLLGMGYFLYGALNGMRLYWEAKRWKGTKGTIISSEITQAGGREHYQIVYTFTAGGESFTGDKPRISGAWFYSSDAQNEFVNSYRPGTEVDVFYDPQSPSLNCIDREDKSSFLAQLIAAILIGIITFSLIFFFLEAPETIVYPALEEHQSY